MSRIASIRAKYALGGFLLLLAMTFLPFPLPAQNTRQVRGTVFDENGDPLPGVVVMNKKAKIGVSTNADGHFVMTGVPADATLSVETMGYKTQQIKVADLKGEAKIYLELDAEALEEVVVTGIFTRRKDSFTGSVQAVTSDEIKRMSNTNVIASLKNIDPSMVVLENLSAGSDPNAMANIQIRGASTLSTATTQALKSDYLTSGNTPLFILDGFETSLQKITDMDMNRVQSITILKDASAKAIYGSKGANGVIVIETKALTGTRSMVTYSGSVTAEIPDLSSYNLCNSLEKLEVERRYGFYEQSTDSDVLVSGVELYNMRLKRALEGEDTYWLSKPLRTGISHKHSLGVELGGKDLKALATFSYNQVNGAMKGSYRRNISGDVNVSYRLGKWTFRNIMSIAFMNKEDSPYGSFYEYARLNPYFTPYDADGNLKKILFSSGYKGSNGTTFNYGTAVTNPMYNALIGTRYAGEYMDFTDNLYAEYQVLPSLRLVGRAGINSQRTKSDDFRPADHTDFANTPTGDETFLRRGSYTVSNGTYTTFSADISAQFNQKIAAVHDIFATAQYNISETNYEEITHYTEGFPNSNMQSITYARQYAQDAIPTGGDGLNRNLGALLTAGYSYDNRYMADATLKASASSVFGTKNRWGLFWSAGLAWNLHNEKFMEGQSWLRQLKLRASLGSSGNQNFTTNTSLPVYRYFSSGYYNGFSGAYLTNMENPDLGWEEKMDYNVGIDFRTNRINMVVDAYIADTRNMMFSRSILPSTGFSTVSDNLGLVRNKGIELQLSYMLYQRGASYFSVFGKVATNDNRVLQISEAMQAFNKQQQAVAEENSQTAPVIQYFDGVPLHAIWTVPSLGIDPVTGDEIFIKQDGTITNTWKAEDLRYSGSSDPLFNGNFGFNGEIKGIGVNFVVTYYGGGYLYNSTLIDKVENTYIEDNVDRRIFLGRWYEPGQVMPFRSGGALVNNESSQVMNMTMPTSRFVQKNNVLNLSSISVYYEFPVSLVRKLKMQRLRTTFYANDLYTFSSIDIERGTSYPYARSFSLSVTATF